MPEALLQLPVALNGGPQRVRAFEMRQEAYQKVLVIPPERWGTGRAKQGDQISLGAVRPHNAVDIMQQRLQCLMALIEEGVMSLRPVGTEDNLALTAQYVLVDYALG